MEQLTSLIHNFNCDCCKQYTKVSPLLGGKLDNSLEEIERFYYSPFWEKRFKRRLQEEDIEYDPIGLDIIQGTTSCLRDDTQFKLFEEDQSSNGISNKKTMIALNVNMSKEKLNDSHINNVIMHEFGHRQYNQKEFHIIVELNQKVFGNIKEQMNDSLSDEDNKYFTDHNELRQRIIPIIKEMYDNDWNADEAYSNSENLKMDDIYKMYNKNYIIYLLNNIL